jgi:hypothetical protein
MIFPWIIWVFAADLGGKDEHRHQRVGRLMAWLPA